MKQRRSTQLAFLTMANGERTPERHARLSVPEVAQLRAWLQLEKGLGTIKDYYVGDLFKREHLIHINPTFNACGLKRDFRSTIDDWERVRNRKEG